MLPPMKTLIRASVYVAVGGMTSVFIMRQLLIDKVKRQEYFQFAMRELRAHEGKSLQKLIQITVVIIFSGAKSILGEPIKDVGIDIGEPNKADKVSAYFEVKASFQIKRYSESNKLDSSRFEDRRRWERFLSGPPDQMKPIPGMFRGWSCRSETTTRSDF